MSFHELACIFSSASPLAADALATYLRLLNLYCIFHSYVWKRQSKAFVQKLTILFVSVLTSLAIFRFFACWSASTLPTSTLTATFTDY